MQTRLARTLVFTIALLATLVAVEIVLRRLGPASVSQELRGLHRVDPRAPWIYEMVPGAKRTDPVTGVEYAVNQHGFRDRERDRARRDGTFRIAVIGDSLTFGYGIALDATFAARLERNLASAHAGRTFEVLNLGVSGYNPYTEAALLRGVGLRYAPDLVLVQFCINDLNDPTLHFDASTMHALGALPEAAFPDPAMRSARAPRLPERLDRACRASRLCTMLSDAIGPARPLDEMRAALAPHDEPSEAEMAWLAGLYATMASEVRSQGGELAVVAFPYETQLAPGGGDVAQQKLRALGERTGITVIDLRPAFRAAARVADAGPLFLDMWHPTARGHEVAADALYRALTCARLLPGVTAPCDPAED